MGGIPCVGGRAAGCCGAVDERICGPSAPFESRADNAAMPAANISASTTKDLGLTTANTVAAIITPATSKPALSSGVMVYFPLPTPEIALGHPEDARSCPARASSTDTGSNMLRSTAGELVIMYMARS